MPNKLKWTSKATKPCVQAMQESILSKEWGDIFGLGFDTSEIDFPVFHQSNDQWGLKFSLKQVRENLSDWINKQICEKGRASNEKDELTDQMGGMNLGDDKDAVLDNDGISINSANPKKVKFPT